MDELQTAINRAKWGRFQSNGAHKPSPAMANTFLYEQITELKMQLSHAKNEIVERDNKITHLRRRIEELRLCVKSEVRLPAEVLAVAQIVCDKHKISLEELLSNSQVNGTMGLRHILYRLLRVKGYSWRKIGTVLKRDISTAQRALQRLAKKRADDPRLDAEISEMEARVTGNVVS